MIQMIFINNSWQDNDFSGLHSADAPPRGRLVIKQDLHWCVIGAQLTFSFSLDLKQDFF